MTDALALVDAILEGYRRELGADFEAYRNHASRVFLRCRRILGEPDAASIEKIAIAAAFHDLAIWTERTWDYLEPSCLLARRYLAQAGRADWAGEIEAMIAWHHKITPCRGFGPLAEAFRRADWRDVLLMPLPEKRPALPNAGFHLRLAELTWTWWKRHPLEPLPMLKW
ncbi:MAG TPA: hypothetical protein VN893_20035 [Bryobacteraceae bacterium]|nr:hypothetical protein [Bryobacteraceae bacterium]